MDVRMPDGTIITGVPEGITQAELLRRYNLSTQQPEGGFVPAVKSGASQLAADVAALAGKTGIISPETAEQYIAEQEAYQRRTFAPTKEGWTEAPWTKFKETLGGSLPYMAAPVAAAGAVAAAPVTGTAATVAGLGAAGLTSAAQFTGSNISRQMREGKSLEEAELSSAAAAALPQAALDVVGFKLIPGIRQIFAAAGKDISQDAALAIAKQTTGQVAKDYARSTGVAMGAEGLTEAGQQALERLQAGLSITDKQARDEYFDSFVGGAVLGGALAPAGRYVERTLQERREAAGEVTPTAPQEPPKLIGYDPSSKEPMYVFSDGSVAVGEDAAFARRYAEQAATEAPGKPKLLGYTPGAGQERMYVFADGSVAIGEDAAFARRYEPQKLSQDELSAIAPDLEGVEFKPVKQEPLPLTAEEEQTQAERERYKTDLSKRAEDLSRVNKENSLFEFFAYRPKKAKAGETPALIPDNRLDISEAIDIASEKTKTGKVIPDKTLNFIRKKGGKNISTFVSEGALNEWLPFELRFYGGEEETVDKEKEATEYIKEALRNQDFLPYETKLELDQIGLTLDAIEQEAQRETDLDDLRDILSEIYQEESSRITESPFPEGPEAGAQEPSGPTRIESAARGEKLTPEQRAIADRELELFALQPQVGERVGAPTADMFGAEGIQQVKPAEPKGGVAPEGQLKLFDGDKDFVENAAEEPVELKPLPMSDALKEAYKVQDAIEGKSAIQVAKWMANNAPDPDQRLIAMRVADRMQKLMNAGIKFSFNVAHIGDRIPRRLVNAKGISVSTIDKAKGVLKVDIWVNSPEVGGNRVGTDYETVLHELVHSVTQGALYIGRRQNMAGTAAAELAKRLNNLSNAVIKHYNARVLDARKAGKVPGDALPTELERRIYNGANALDDADEILAWGLSSREMQDYLESIPYKGTTAWSEFVNAIRKFLGLPNNKETALAELLSISDELFGAPLVEVGKIAAPTGAEPTKPIPSTEQIELFSARIAGMKPSEALKALATKKKPPPDKLTAEGENAQRLMERLGSISNPKPKAADETLVKRFKAVFTPKDNISLEARIRRAVVDKDAPVIEQLQTKFNNRVKDELGFIRPDLNLMQAQDTTNFGDLMAQKGGIEIGNDGLIHVFENKDANGKPINLDRVLQLITIDLGKKLGSADLAMQLSHNALIAQRADEIIKNNKRIEIRAENMKAAADSMAKSSDPEKKKAARQMRSDAERMLKEKIEVRATKEEIDAGLEAMRMYPEIREAYEVFTAYKNNLVDFLEQTGRISSGTAENWKQNAGYVPWTRIEEETNKFEMDPRGFKNGVINLSALPKLDKEGSTKEINNIFDNMVGLTYWAVRSGINNFAAQRTLNTLPDVKIIPDEEGAVSEMRKNHPDRLVFSYEDGKRQAYLLANPLQLATFSTIAPLKGGMFSAVFAPAARFLRATITHMPAFAVSQLIQDGTYRAALLSGVKNPWKVPPRVFKNFYKALRKKKEGALGELERLGVSGIYDGMPESTARRLRIRNGLEHRNAFKKAWDALEDFSLAADLAVRAAIYEQTVAETGDRALAYYRAKEYINFKRQGTDPIVYELRQSIPFFNAYLQGMDVLYRTMVGKGVSTAERKAAMKLFYVTGMQIAALNLLYAMMMSGDDDYEGLDDYVRNRNYILPGGFKLPVAPEVGFLFKVIPEQLYRAVMSEGVQTPQDATAVAKRLTGAFADAFGGVEYLPQLIKPVVELSTNYSFFLETPIVGAGFKNVESAEQFTESTSELAKMIGGMANISPMKLDYFIRAYTGMAGALGLELTDSLMNPDRMGKPIYKTPQISTFMYDPTGRGFKSDFYKFREEIDKVADTVNMMKREGRGEELADYLTEEKATRYALRGMVNKVEKQLSNLRNYRKIIAADTSLSPEERRTMTREILDEERELIKAYDVKELRKIAGF